MPLWRTWAGEEVGSKGRAPAALGWAGRSYQGMTLGSYRSWIEWGGWDCEVVEFLVSVEHPRTLEVLGWGTARSLVAGVGSCGSCLGATLMVLLT